MSSTVVPTVQQFNKAREALALTHKSEKQAQDKSHNIIKKSASKLNKSEKKEKNKLIAAEVLALKEKQKKEILELEEKFGMVKVVEELVKEEDDDDEKEKIISKQETTAKPPTSEITQPQTPPKKLTKAQKIRLKKEREEKELQQRIAAAKAEENANFGKSPKYLENYYINQYLSSNNLKSIDIKSDGSCLFQAIIESTLPEKSLSHLTSSKIRSQVADHLIGNKEQYLPFMELDSDKNETFESYIEKLRNSEIWGGHLEIISMAKILDLEITVVQWNGQKGTDVQRFVDEGRSESSNSYSGKCTILFYKHLSQSSHYNGAVPL